MIKKPTLFRRARSILVASVVGFASVAATAAAEDHVSREYKLSLALTQQMKENPAGFADGLARELGSLALKTGATSAGELRETKPRGVVYLDVAGACPLRDGLLVLRERTTDKGRQITLKLRSSDRAVVSDAKLAASAGKSKTKVEEDVSPPMNIRLAKSTTVTVETSFEHSAWQRIVDLFPYLKDLPVSNDERLSVVQGARILQREFELPSLQWGALLAETSMTLWYRSGEDHPIAAEVSFRVPNASLVAAEDNPVNQFYRELQRKAFVDANSSSASKTEFIYSASPSGYCEK